MTSNKIRLFVDAHCFDKEHQGSRTFVREIYRALVNKKDILIYLAAYDAENLKQHFPHADNIKVLKYRSRSALLRLTIDIPLLIKKHRIDYAHFQYITPLIKNCKQIVTIHDVIFNDYRSEFSYSYRLLKKFLYRRAASNADILTTVSPFSKSSIERHLAVKTKVHLVANGVSNIFFESYNKSKAKSIVGSKYGFDKFILYISRIEPRKNHEALIKAYLELKLYENGYYLVMIGHTTIRVTALTQIVEKIDPSVRKFLCFINNIQDEDLVEFYRAADIFVYPSKAEGFGIPPLEAAAAKVPVICSNTSAMQDFSFFGDYHIDPCDEKTLKSKLSELIRNDPDHSKLSQIAEKIKADYCWKQSAEKLYQIITTHQS